jgi:hypothetical protein
MLSEVEDPHAVMMPGQRRNYRVYIRGNLSGTLYVGFRAGKCV